MLITDAGIVLFVCIALIKLGSKPIKNTLSTQLLWAAIAAEIVAFAIAGAGASYISAFESQYSECPSNHWYGLVTLVFGIICLGFVIARGVVLYKQSHRYAIMSTFLLLIGFGVASFAALIISVLCFTF
jgi:hypothetical protein